jgi:tRNA (Thr-GGU) A37 N-methylase
VEITGIEGDVIDVIGLDAVDGTPLLDIKCVV